jgi:ribosomal protein S18 acetylase RimI-like enzyme
MTDSLRSPSAMLDDDVALLSASDVRQLRVPWDARYSRQEIIELVTTNPGLSLWNPRTGGYLLASEWRHRSEIANVVDIVGPSVADQLLRSFIANCAARGYDLAVVAEYAERRRSTFYLSAGMEVVEDIIVYELGRIPNEYAAPVDLRGLKAELMDIDETDQLRELLAVDHAAFPWLWWNSAGEFENYAAVPGVVIEGVREPGGPLVGYIGTTSLGSWGHLDRIAVDPRMQGRGLGRMLLDHAIYRLKAKGARRIALSTQSSNHVSRALYESAGFRRSRAHDYRIYGRRLLEQGRPGLQGMSADE